jgi:N-acetylglutamate synthase-like GNAT family acetyltransferase
MPAANEGFSLRPARPEDQAAIRQLIRDVGINPLGLHWERFVLAVDAPGAMIGCGQIKIHGDGSRELASIAVVEAWRGRGVASEIIHHLIARHDPPLYLTCRAGLGTFYQRFGFRPAQTNELPPYFRRLERLVGLFRFLRLMPREGLLIMIYPPRAAEISLIQKARGMLEGMNTEGIREEIDEAR